MNASPTGRIDVLSCGSGVPDSHEARICLEAADIVFGSRALLAVCPVLLKESRVIGANAREKAAEALALCRQGQRVAVLASGDALYHGFGGTLSSMAAPEDPVFYHPGITAFQTLFHRLGLPWQKAGLFSVHAGERLPVRAIAETPLAVVYAGTRFPAQAIAETVLQFQPEFANRAAVIAEGLGTPEERIVTGTLATLAAQSFGPTSILLLLPQIVDSTKDVLPLPAPILPLGLPEDAYERENNLITASDVRAVILSRLRLPAWGTLWDIGAGSGSIGLEAACLRPGLRVFGVERKAERGESIMRNSLRLGVANYVLRCGDALPLVQTFAQEAQTPLLPTPDRVFIGGGGRKLLLLLDACFERLVPTGLLVASAVTLESFHALSAWKPENRTDLIRLDIARERPIAQTSHHLKHQHTIYVFVFQKKADMAESKPNRASVRECPLF